MEYMYTHQKTEPSQICQENNQYWVPNRHHLHKNGPPHQTYVRTNWPKWPIITLCAHKQSTIDTRQNQLAKCSNDIQCSQTVLNGRHSSEPTVKCSKSTFCWKEKFAQMDLLGCGACQLVQAHVSIPPRKCVCLQPVPSRGDCSGSLKQMVSPKAPSWGQWALSSEFLAAILAIMAAFW